MDGLYDENALTEMISEEEGRPQSRFEEGGRSRNVGTASEDESGRDEATKKALEVEIIDVVMEAVISEIKRKREANCHSRNHREEGGEKTCIHEGNW